MTREGEGGGEEAWEWGGEKGEEGEERECTTCCGGGRTKV